MANIDNLSRTRRGHGSAVTKFINSVMTILADFQEKDRIKLMSLQASLSDKGHLLDNLNEQILSLIEDEDETGTDIDRAIEVDLTTKECLFEIQAVLLKNDNNPPSSNDTLNNIASRNSNSNGKLPSLKVKQFYGNLLEHQSFWDSFRATVHENDTLRDITKFSYLKSYLEGQSLSAISGISLSEENYSEAIEILEKRFGNKQILISSNIDQLLSISLVESLTDIKKIRYIYDKIEPAVRNLKSLKVDIRQYGPVLISIIMNKLSTEIKLQISRIMPATEEWNVTNLLEVLLQEISSRELSKYMSHANFKQNP